MRKSFLVIGLGTFGSSLAKTLYEMGHDVLAVDNDMDKVRDIKDYVTETVQLDATHMDSLKTLGISNFDVVVVGRGTDLADSILITLNLKELGAKYIMAKALTDPQRKILERMGVNRIVFPERDMGIRIAHTLSMPQIVDYIELTDDYKVEELMAPPTFVGKTLDELALRTSYGVNVLAIKREGRVNAIPGPNDTVMEGDTLVIVGQNDKLERLAVKSN